MDTGIYQQLLEIRHHEGRALPQVRRTAYCRARFCRRAGGAGYNATEQNPNGDEVRALQVAKSEYFSRLSTMYASDTQTRVMSIVTLARADGRQIMAERIGTFPDMTPAIEEETNDVIETEE